MLRRASKYSVFGAGPVARALDAPNRLTETEVAADYGNQAMSASYEIADRPSNSAFSLETRYAAGDQAKS